MTVGNDLRREHRVRREASALAAAGHEVIVHGVLSPETVEAEEAEGFSIRRTRLPGWVHRGDGVAGGWRILRWYERFAPLCHAAAAAGPDVIHAHDLDTVGPALRAAADLGARLVFDDHEASYVDKLANFVPADVRGGKRALLALALRRLVRHGERLERRVRSAGPAGLVTVSESLADALVERFGGPRPVVVRNCPPWREVRRSDALRERLGAPAQDRLLLYHGTVTEGCGVETAIRALQRLGPGHRLVVLGWAWRQDLLEALAAEEGVADRVHFLAGVPQDEMFRLVASADVGLIPTEPNSVGNRLGIPNKLFESFISGLPVVCTDLPEVGPLVRDSGSGVLYPARDVQDPAELAAAIRKVLDDPQAAEAMRAGGLAAARESHNWDVESSKLVAMYGRIEVSGAASW